MRLIENRRARVSIYKRIAAPDALGACPERYANACTLSSCALAPVSGDLEPAASGLLHRQKLNALFPKDTDIAVGDILQIGDDTAPNWRVTSVFAWTAHIEASLERRAAC